MAQENNKNQDYAVVEMNPQGVLEEGYTLTVIDGKRSVVEHDTPESLPDRPTGDDKKTWVNYCVALGADKNYLTKKTLHATPLEELEEHSPLTVDELKELASSLGG